MGKFRQISTELLPFIRAENWFPCSISRIFGRLSSNFVYELIFKRSDLGLFMGNFRQISAFIALDSCKKNVSVPYLGHLWLIVVS